ncbi:uncharacterized protein SPPG_04466 [Spizellomyces punctatus DAOM BR117]|uniref:F-box domain-containing protein n=1 Tax=Spizellomyces punctatus (strain DAOM BR117) TaxID=645134 RepID=A0A0L0HH65_SPIPD|nr:uncharacterized protein SPPG_04466 [Spizellomyces punctatus DAOM BR117]KND00124.1 hypothetical protein SPPG_04466 [Spizellomyces punctatus DAOM BR117]|eukprot:XP_016608163.1 hypothetical protein SPPG_04466 [Spizellomyces punctatus DAOM BR117]
MASHTRPQKRPCGERFWLRGDNARLRDFTEFLSDEIILYIFAYLSHQDLACIASASRSWKRLASDQYLWKRLFMDRFSLLPPPPRQSLTQQCKPSRADSPTSGRELCSSSRTRKSSMAGRIMQEREDWHSMYILQHNWHVGNCRITSLDVSGKIRAGQDDNTSISTYPTTKTAGYAVNATVDRKSNPVVTFTKDLIFSSTFLETSCHSPEINVWRIEDQSHVGTLVSSSNLPASVIITTLRIDEGTGNHGANPKRVIAGYSTGGFTLWSFSTKNDNGTSGWKAEELCTIHRNAQGRSLLSVAILNNYVVTCSSDFDLVVYKVQGTSSNERQTCIPIHHLRGSSCWAPVDLHFEQNQHDGQYLLYVSYAAPTLHGEWDVGVQEFRFTDTMTLVTTRHYTPAPVGFSMPRGTSPLTCIRFRPPYLVTAHADNRVEVYRLVTAEAGTRKSLPRAYLIHASTLYAHAAAVMALELDAVSGKLITGGVDGLKIWKLATSAECLYGDMAPDPVVTLMDDDWAKEWETGITACGRGPRWLGFDEGKIVSVSGGWWIDKFEGRSREGLKMGGNEFDNPVGVVKIFSFLDE